MSNYRNELEMEQTALVTAEAAALNELDNKKADKIHDHAGQKITPHDVDLSGVGRIRGRHIIQTAHQHSAVSPIIPIMNELNYWVSRGNIINITGDPGITWGAAEKLTSPQTNGGDAWTVNLNNSGTVTIEFTGPYNQNFNTWADAGARRFYLMHRSSQAPSAIKIEVMRNDGTLTYDTIADDTNPDFSYGLWTSGEVATTAFVTSYRLTLTFASAGVSRISSFGLWHPNMPLGWNAYPFLGGNNEYYGINNFKGSLRKDGNDVAVQSWVQQQIADLVDSSPATLDTLNELAAALGDDPNFATTVTNLIAQKAAKALMLTAGNGLTGGGDLSADRAFEVDFSEVATAAQGAKADNSVQYIGTVGDLDDPSLAEGIYKCDAGTLNNPMDYYGVLIVRGDINQRVDMLHGDALASNDRLLTRRWDIGNPKPWTEYWSNRHFSQGDIDDWNTALQPGALSGYALEDWVEGRFDNYKFWKLWINGSQKTSVNSDQKVDLTEGNNIKISYSAGGVVTFSVRGLTIADIANLANALAGKKDDFSVLPVTEGGTGETDLSDLKEETALIAKAQTSGFVRITTAGNYAVKKTDHTIMHIVASGLSELQLDAVEIHGFQIKLVAGSNNLTLNKDLYNPSGVADFPAGTNIGSNGWEIVYDKSSDNWYYLGI